MRARNLLSFLLLLRLMLPGTGSMRSQDVRPLVPGVPIERELAGGEAHSYQVALASGEYLHVVVEQRGIDVIVTVFGPDGQQLADVNKTNATQGLEPVSLWAETSGRWFSKWTLKLPPNAQALMWISSAPHCRDSKWT